MKEVIDDCLLVLLGSGRRIERRVTLDLRLLHENSTRFGCSICNFFAPVKLDLLAKPQKCKVLYSSFTSLVIVGCENFLLVC